MQLEKLKFQIVFNNKWNEMFYTYFTVANAYMGNLRDLSGRT